jgi:hypothetical protein
MRGPLGGSPRRDRLFKQAVRALIFLRQWLEDFWDTKSKDGVARRTPERQAQLTARVDRQVAPEEAAVVRWLLDHSYVSEASAYAGASTESLRVMGECTCGCRSIDFSPDTAGASIISDAPVVYPDGQEAEVILWGRDGQITALEVIDHTEGTSGRLPQLSELRTWEARGRELAEGGSA